MTAANVFAREGGAWLFFDTAVYDDDGYILSFRSKVVPCERLMLAVGVCGLVPSTVNAIIGGWLDRYPTQQAVLADAPALLAEISAAIPDTANRAPLWRRLIWGAPKLPRLTGLRLAFAWWDRDGQQGRAGIITSDDEFGPAYPAGELHPVNTVTSPKPALGEWFDWDDDLQLGADFVPDRDGAALGQMQRLEPNPRGCRIGGTFERFHVHAGGITRAAVAEWPDRIGRPIKVAA